MNAHAPSIKDNLVPRSPQESLLCNLVLRGRDPFGQRQGSAAARLRFQSLLRFRVDSKKMIPKNHRSTKIRNPETEYGIKYQWWKLKNFTLRNLVQSKENLFQFSLNFLIILLMCLDMVCQSVIYCTAKPIEVILQLIFIHEFIGWIIQLNITFLAKCHEQQWLASDHSTW